MDFDKAIENASRILENAEAETNLATMERLEKLADSWLALANILLTREQMRT